MNWFKRPPVEHRWTNQPIVPGIDGCDSHSARWWSLSAVEMSGGLGLEKFEKAESNGDGLDNRKREKREESQTSQHKRALIRMIGIIKLLFKLPYKGQTLYSPCKTPSKFVTGRTNRQLWS